MDNEFFVEYYRRLLWYNLMISEYDNYDYIGNFFAGVKCNEISRGMLQQWFQQYVACMMGKGVNKKCLIIEGKQGTGKSLMMNSLNITPPPMELYFHTRIFQIYQQLTYDEMYKIKPLFELKLKDFENYCSLHVLLTSSVYAAKTKKFTRTLWMERFCSFYLTTNESSIAERLPGAHVVIDGFALPEKWNHNYLQRMCVQAFKSLKIEN